jgi:hypothetical protein
MAVHSHRRQVLLFLAAVLVPCIALVGLGLRLVVQERELSRGRVAEEKRRVVALLRDELRNELEGIALRQIAAAVARPGFLVTDEYGDPVVALIARVSDGRLVLPWEADRRAGATHRVLGRAPFAEQVRAGEQIEFGGGDPARAVAAYRRALVLAEDTVQGAHARLFLARALRKAGRDGDASVEYRKVAALTGVVDRQGIPLSLYAVRQLLEMGVSDEAVVEPLRAVLLTDEWLAPPAIYLLQDLVLGLIERVADEPFEPAVRRLSADVAVALARTERALALQRDFPALGLPVGRSIETEARARVIEATDAPSGASRQSRLPWVRHGPWLVGTAPMPEGESPLIIAVDPVPVLTSLELPAAQGAGAMGARIVVSHGAGRGDEPLGPELPGLSVLFQPPRPDGVAAVGSARWWFYGAGLALVVGATLFGAYLLWRDTRREVALAAMRSQFVSAVSHELKTPLTAIRMFAESLQMGRPADLEGRGEYLETIVNESERLTRLLNNVLDFSKIERNRKTYHRQLTALDEVVRRSARAMHYPLEQEGFALHVRIEADLPPARVDRDAIEQAVLNLLANAMKYSGDSREIELRLRCEDGSAVIDVEDRGLGIESGEQERIFDRFYRVPDAAFNGVPGAGLGLTLVRHIAEAHGGRITVDSVPGEGSTFSLFIPLEREEP